MFFLRLCYNVKLSKSKNTMVNRNVKIRMKTGRIGKQKVYKKFMGELKKILKGKSAVKTTFSPDERIDLVTFNEVSYFFFFSNFLNDSSMRQYQK